ncbi:hypothetical protein [Natrinema gelatinilyticum]|uniref:hypothetical protein n=1 Tax=Natrinema gelatinilyticum TaxID=2961571 RepID=UPI0020C3F48B|nr:hypothetical protein [Natrinema gelatinilyticum]
MITAGISTFASQLLILSGFVCLRSRCFSSQPCGSRRSTLAVAVGSTGWRRYVAQKRLIQVGLVPIGAGLLVLTQRTAPDLTIIEMILPMTIIGVALESSAGSHMII